jgi:predicted outer membrane lipoprotein
LQPRVASTLGKVVKKKIQTLKALASREALRSLANAFSVSVSLFCESQGCREAPTFGLKLANAFGVGLQLANAFGVGLKLTNAFGVGLQLANAFGVGLQLANAFGVGLNWRKPSALG